MIHIGVKEQHFLSASTTGPGLCDLNYLIRNTGHISIEVASLLFPVSQHSSFYWSFPFTCQTTERHLASAGFTQTANEALIQA